MKSSEEVFMNWWDLGFEIEGRGDKGVFYKLFQIDSQTA